MSANVPTTTAPATRLNANSSEHASPADLRALAFDADDVNALKTCREGSCDVQLPTAGINLVRDRVDWSKGDATDQVNALLREGVLNLVQAYRGGGNESLGEYRDKQRATRIADEFQTMIGRASVLPDVLPELRQYLLEYPRAELAGADSFFYWEKVAFGLKPTIRVNHAVIHRGRAKPRLRHRRDQAAPRLALLSYRTGHVCMRR